MIFFDACQEPVSARGVIPAVKICEERKKPQKQQTIPKMPLDRYVKHQGNAEHQEDKKRHDGYRLTLSQENSRLVAGQYIFMRLCHAKKACLLPGLPLVFAACFREGLP